MTVQSVAAIQRDARHAAAQGRVVNPFPEGDPAHEVWADAYTAARLTAPETRANLLFAAALKRVAA